MKNYTVQRSLASLVSAREVIVNCTQNAYNLDPSLSEERTEDLMDIGGASLLPQNRRPQPPCG